MKIRRDFVDTEVGQLHFVANDRAENGKATLVMIPQMSALEQIPLMEALGDRPMIALDPVG